MIETPELMAFLDANVLYPNLLRNLLMYFGVADIYQPRWSMRVHQEWMSALAQNRPDISAAKIERIRTLMDDKIHDAMVEGYEHRIASITLPDPDDRHVLAAAIQCGATIIVTANRRDFPATTLAQHNIVAENPDVFLLRLVNEDHDRAIEVFRDLCRAYTRPPQTPQDIIVRMQRSNLTITANTLDGLLGRY